MNLSQHFTISEMTRSEWAARNGVSMDPPPKVLAMLERLANEVLEPLRDAIGAPIYVSSGYRPLTVNAAVGGSLNSAHMDGRAADFVAIGMPLDETARRAREACESLPVGKLIVEFNRWIHVQIEPLGVTPRRIYLTADRGELGTVYREWRV